MKIARESFPTPAQRKDFKRLWDSHGIEVRGTPLVLDFERYEQIERDGRLICIVARRDGGNPAGYSWHWWYKSMHFGTIVGHDDLWYVDPPFRRFGFGQLLRRAGLDALREAGAVETSDYIRLLGVAPRAMANLGYELDGLWWKRAL